MLPVYELLYYKTVLILEMRVLGASIARAVYITQHFSLIFSI